MLALERLVRAMLRPRLGQRFQLHVGRVAAGGAEMLLDRPHLGQAQRQLAVAAQLQQSRIVQLAQRHDGELEAVRSADRQMFQRQRPLDDLLHRFVGQHLAEQHRPGVRRQRRPVIAPKAAHGIDGHAQVAGRRPPRSARPGPSRRACTAPSPAGRRRYARSALPERRFPQGDRRAARASAGRPGRASAALPAASRAPSPLTTAAPPLPCVSRSNSSATRVSSPSGPLGRISISQSMESLSAGATVRRRRCCG